jgi:hypothetical protein
MNGLRQSEVSQQGKGTTLAPTIKDQISMIIDWHAHIYTPEEAANDKGTWDGKDGPSWGVGGCAMVIEKFLRAHYETGIDVSVVTNAAQLSAWKECQ